MTVEVFVRDVPVPPVPLELVPHLTQVMQTAGHQIRWDPAQRTIMIDSPLDGCLIRCVVESPHSRMAGLIATGLVRWVHQAGAAIVQGADRRADLTVIVRAEPLPQGAIPSIRLGSRPRRWFSRRPSLATSAATKLRDALSLPVAITHRWSGKKNELAVHVAAPENKPLAQLLAKAIWQGLMAHFGTGEVTVYTSLLAAPLPPPERTRPAPPAPAAAPPRPATAEASPQPATAEASPHPASSGPQTAADPAPQPPVHRAPQAAAPEPERPKPPKPARVVWASEGPDPERLTPTPPGGFPQSAPALTAPLLRMPMPSYRVAPASVSASAAAPPATHPAPRR